MEQSLPMTEKVARQMEAAVLNPLKQVIQPIHWAKAQKGQGFICNFCILIISRNNLSLNIY